VVTSWLILQAADLLFPALSIQDWAFQLLLGLLLLFFLPALIFSWVYEMTPEGLKREKDVDHDSAEMIASGIKINKVIAVLLALAIVVVGLDRLFPEPHWQLATTPGVESPELNGSEGALSESKGLALPPGQSIAVFPFVNRSDDAGNEHFSSSMAEQVLNLLFQVPGLQVTSRSSAFASAEQLADPVAFTRPLNVASILEGSVQHDAGQIRVTAQLIDAGSGRLLWSETYDRPEGHIFLAQDELAAAIVDRVAAVLLVGLLPSEEIGVDPADAVAMHPP
jgi:TolB-like protein